MYTQIEIRVINILDNRMEGGGGLLNLIYKTFKRQLIFKRVLFNCKQQFDITLLSCGQLTIII